MLEAWPDELSAALPAYLSSQRWFAGGPAAASGPVTVEVARRLWSDDASRELWQLLVLVDGSRYQLILGARPSGESADFLNGHDAPVLGVAEGSFLYDAMVDPDLAKVLLEVVSEGREQASTVRRISAEQSNSSLVYDDRLIFKVFRRIWPGSNPDVDVASALSNAGFGQVAAPLVRWQDLGYDLAFGQQYLAGGSEGWALALTSLRDLYGSPGGLEAGEAGGDFAGEAERLGRMTAAMHSTLLRVFGPASPSEAEAIWGGLVEGLAPRLERAGQVAGMELLDAARPLLRRLEGVGDPGPFCRVHGDYHLGQVMRTDAGWHVLDFEGEPDRPVAERVRPASPLKDVAGMLRSFHYASRHALVERATSDQAEGEHVASTWELHNRNAFVDGYRQSPGVAELLPDDEGTVAAVSAGYELDKALYELDYELGHRPEWAAIPLDALARLLGEGAGSV